MKKETEKSHQEKHEALMNHVILPRCLPQNRSNNYHSEELALLSNMVRNVEHLANWLPEKTVKMFRALDRVHKTPSAQSVSTEIRNLKPGDTFAMFVRRQNCALMVHMPPKGDGDRVVLATFPGNLHPKLIDSAESDIEVRIKIKSINNDS